MGRPFNVDISILIDSSTPAICLQRGKNRVDLDIP